MRNESFGLSSWVFYDVGCQTIFLSWKFSDVVFQSCDDWCKELVYGRSFCVFTAWCWSAMCCVVVGRAKLYFNSLFNEDCRNSQQPVWLNRLDTRHQTACSCLCRYKKSHSQIFFTFWGFLETMSIWIYFILGHNIQSKVWAPTTYTRK